MFGGVYEHTYVCMYVRISTDLFSLIVESPQEKDKLDQMLSMLNDDEDFDPIR